MKLKIKKTHPDAPIPERANHNDSGLDLYAMALVKECNLYIEFDTGIAMEIPPGHTGLLLPRSSISNYDHSLANTTGIIDPGYRDSIKVRLRKSNLSGECLYYKIGDKIAQIIIIQSITAEIVEVNDLAESERGIGAFGSTDNKY